MANPSFVSFLDPSVAADQYALDQRQQMAQMLQAQSMKPIEAQQGMRVQPRINPLQGIAQIAQALMAGKMNEDNTQARGALAQKSMSALAAALGGGAPNTQSAPGDFAPGEAPNVPMGNPQSGGNFTNQQPGTNTFGIGNLIRGSVIDQLGGANASSAYWDQFKNPEIVKQIRASGIDPNSPQGQAMVKAVADKAGYQAPENVREGSTLVDKFGKPTFNAPKDGRQITYDAQGQPTVNIVPGGMAAITAEEAAKKAGANQQTLDPNAMGPDGQPLIRTIGQSVGMAIPGASPELSNAMKIMEKAGYGFAPKGDPGAPGVPNGPNLSDKARLAAQGGHLAEEEQTIKTDASTALNKVAQNNKMIDLLPSITTGPLNKQITTIKNLAASVGADVGDPAPNQEFEKYAIQGALSSAKQIYGARVTNQDVITQIQSNPGATMTEKAMYQMLKYDNLIQQRKMDKQTAYYGEYKGDKAGFSPWFDQTHPILGVSAPSPGQTAAQSAPGATFKGKAMAYNPATGKIE